MLSCCNDPGLPGCHGNFTITFPLDRMYFGRVFEMLVSRCLVAAFCIAASLAPALVVAGSVVNLQSVRNVEMPNAQMTLVQGSSKNAKYSPMVGDRVNTKRVHMVENPGKYGLGRAPAKDRYAIIGHQLVRINPNTGQILSIIRRVDKIID